MLEAALFFVSQKVSLILDFFTFILHFMLDPGPNPVPEPECITVPVPLRQKVLVPLVLQHIQPVFSIRNILVQIRWIRILLVFSLA